MNELNHEKKMCFDVTSILAGTCLKLSLKVFAYLKTNDFLCVLLISQLGHFKIKH